MVKQQNEENIHYVYGGNDSNGNNDENDDKENDDSYHGWNEYISTLWITLYL